MPEKIISCDLETKQKMLNIIDYLENITLMDETRELYLRESITSLEEIRKRMRVFVKPKKDSKTFSIRVNPNLSEEEINSKLDRIRKKIIEYYKSGDKTV